MEVVYLLIPLAALLVIVIVAAFLWAVRSGQFDDLEGPAYSILMDDDEEPQGNDGSTDRRSREDSDPR